MSDHIEVDGRKYYEESYLKLANANCKRRDERIKQLKMALKLADDTLSSLEGCFPETIYIYDDGEAWSDYEPDSDHEIVVIARTRAEISSALTKSI